MMERKRAWIYCRLALNQPDSAVLLAAQRSRLETYAKEQGFEIVGSSSDIASGMDFDNRPGLLEFHNEAVDGNVDILLVSDLSRLGRTSDATLQYWSLLRDLNVIVYTADGGKVDMSVDPLIEKIIELCKSAP
ncbi:recombinase family protein [Acutalibacter muris]|uniref:recombinase family protein n=1 Tax=Acutalibacter muris TaxID=1796620 RepID=UPI00272D11CC|nr:recombinase family protein [Acutalibacter muris]